MPVLIVMSHSGGYPLSLIVTYGMSSAYCALVLGDRYFPDILFCQVLLFCFYLRKYVNNLVIHRQKSTFAKFTAGFSCNFKNFDLECHG